MTVFLDPSEKLPLETLVHSGLKIELNQRKYLERIFTQNFIVHTFFVFTFTKS